MNDLLTDRLRELAATVAVPPTSHDDDLLRGRRRLRRTRALTGGAAVVVVAAVAAAAALTIPHLDSGRAVEPSIAGTSSSPAAPSRPAAPPTSSAAGSGIDACNGYDSESKQAPQARIRGARDLGALDLGPTTVHIFGNGTKYVTCDAWSGYGGMTLFKARSVDAPLGKDRFRMSMDFQNSGASEYVAGGLVPKGVSAITYRFPGHASVAATIADRVWAVAYFPKKQLPDNAEVTVDVTTATGPRTYRLEVGPDDFCMQVNHGC